MIRMVIALAATAQLCACGGARPHLPPVRYRNQAPVWRVSDRMPVPKPKEHTPELERYYYDAYFIDSVDRALSFQPRRRALGVNSLDEVPDSTWFTNRIGVREMTVEEIARGPNRTDGPDRSKPWKVVGAKPSGQAVGFRIEDGRGDEYFIKFDERGMPESETAADVVAQRLLWAFGYNVPQNMVVWFDRDDIDPGDEMTEEELDEVLEHVEREPDGSWRALASLRIPGEAVGSIRPEGVRPDDPNDTVPHERRRDLRGQFVAFSWLNHTDVKPHNTLEVWRPVSKGARTGHVVAYTLDFGKTLGVFALTNDAPWIGHRRTLDGSGMLRSLVTFGTWRRPWERADPTPRLRGVGVFTADRFDPGDWKSNAPWVPFEGMDRFDGFWAAKIIMRFSPQLIRTAVEQGRYSDTRAIDYITGVLVERQRRIGRHWFAQVTPLDQFRVVGGGKLCFVDLWLSHDMESKRRRTVYRARVYDFDGDSLGADSTEHPTSAGRACTSLPALPSTGDGYAILEIRTTRGRQALDPVYVHIARDPRSKRPRVIGLGR